MDMFDTRTMLSVVEEAQKKSKTFLRDSFFGNRVTYDTKKIDVDIVGAGGRKVAPYVHPKVGGVVVEREGYKTESYEAPEVSPMRVTTAEDMLKRAPGETVYNGKSPNQRAAEQLGKDLSQLDDIITRREEVMCAEALFTGQISIKGEGYGEGQVIRYWPSEVADRPYTALPILWNTAEATPAVIMKQLRDLRRSVIQKSGFTPTQLICGTKVIDALLDKLTEAKALDMRRVDMGHVDPHHLPQGVTYWGYLKDSGLDIYSYDEWYINDEGVEVPMVPEELCLMASPNARTTLAYGVVGLIGDDGVQFHEGARVPDSWTQRHAPAGRIVQIKARPLPIVHQIHGFHVIKAI